MFGVFVTNDTYLLGDLPVDTQIRIIEQDAAICFRMIEVVTFIGKDSLIAQYGEPMRKPARDKELSFVLVT